MGIESPESPRKTRDRYIFHATAARVADSLLATWVKDSGAELIRPLGGGMVLAWADAGAIQRLGQKHPEVHAEPDLVLYTGTRY